MGNYFVWTEWNEVDKMKALNCTLFEKIYIKIKIIQIELITIQPPALYPFRKQMMLLVVNVWSCVNDGTDR